MILLAGIIDRHFVNLQPLNSLKFLDINTFQRREVEYRHPKEVIIKHNR